MMQVPAEEIRKLLSFRMITSQKTLDQVFTLSSPPSLLLPPNSFQVMAKMDVNGDGKVDRGSAAPASRCSHDEPQPSFFLMHAHAASAVLHLNLEPIFRCNSSFVVSNPSGGSELVKFIINDGKDKDDSKYCTCWLPSISSRVVVMFCAGTGTL
jgi:hypothetical protein